MATAPPAEIPEFVRKGPPSHWVPGAFALGVATGLILGLLAVPALLDRPGASSAVLVLPGYVLTGQAELSLTVDPFCHGELVEPGGPFTCNFDLRDPLAGSNLSIEFVQVAGAHEVSWSPVRGTVGATPVPYSVVMEIPGNASSPVYVELIVDSL